MSTTEAAYSLPLALSPAGGLRGVEPSSGRVCGVPVAFVLLGFAAVWLSVLSFTSFSPPVDNVEQLVWIRSLAWGYYKHPPLTTWIAWAAAQVFGSSAITTYVLGASTTLAAIAIYWRVLLELRGPQYAWVGLLSALCITFYNGRLYYYNHNVVLLLLVSVTAWLCWRASQQPSLRWWLAIGLAMGLGALTKYQMAVCGASVACFWISQRAWRVPLHRRGALLAVLLALLVFVPHILWLRANGFGPITYAMESSLGVGLTVAGSALDSALWLVDELLNRAAPAFILLAVTAVSLRRVSRPRSADAGAPDHGRHSRALLLSFGVVPMLFMPLVGIAFGSELQLQWGTAFLLWVVPCAMECLPRSWWSRVAPDTALKTFCALQVLLVAINVATSPVGIRFVRDTHWRTFSAVRLAEMIAPQARGQLGGPVQVLIGPVAEAGVLALQLPEHPTVLVDGRYDRSPWVSRDVVAACGALALMTATRSPPGWSAVGEPFPMLYWRVQQPQRGSGECHIPTSGTVMANSPGVESRRLAGQALAQ